MIYLIGGGPRCGKTILAKRLARRTGAWWLSTDTVYNLVEPLIPKSQRARRLPSTRLHGDAHHYGFELHSPADLLKGEVGDARTLWPGIRNLIEEVAGHGNDMVLEGTGLLPSLVSQLGRLKQLRGRVRTVYLVKTDLELIAAGLLKNREGAAYDWLAGRLDSRQRVEAAARMIQAKSIYFAREARRWRLPVVDTDREFEAGLKRAAGLLGLNR